MCNMRGFGISCDCAYLCDIGVECFEDMRVRKYKRVRLFEDVVISYMMSDVSIDSTLDK